MIKVLLLVAAFSRNVPQQIEAYPPLGILELSAYLKSRGVECRMLDLALEKNPLGRLSEELCRHTPDVVGISSIVANFSSSLEAAKFIKKKDTRCVVVMGGIYPTFADREILEANEEVDFIVRGEGEIVFEKLIRALDNGGDIGTIYGLSYRSGKRYLRNPDAKLISNIDDLPLPDYRSLDTMEKYGQNGKFLIVSSRGCPYSCSFCSTSNYWKHRWRAKGAGKVVEEIRVLVEQYGARKILIGDDLFIVDRKRVFDICEGINRHGLSFRWRCSVRANLFTAEMLTKMKKAGCDSVFLGVESGVQKSLDRMNKRQNLKEVLRAREVCKKLGVKLIASFIVGLPWETKKDIEQTIRFAKRLDADESAWFVFHPDVGSPIYDSLDQSSASGNAAFESDDCLKSFESSSGTETLSPEEVEELYLRAVLETS